VLIGVHVVIAIHVASWLWLGTTVSPFELNETMFTLELGIVTIGAMLMVLIVLSTLIFGRFFCSWGCHVLALQDLAAWLLGKIGVRPKPVRSRLLLLGPLAVMATMFIWPQIERLAVGRPFPSLHVTTDSEGFGSLVTSDFLRNLPGPAVSLLTFAVCGGLIVYLLGSRSFCRYVCPYGAVFAAADRLSPGKIRLDPRADCTQCAACTAACSSDIRVHAEISAFGRVVSPNCLKDLDCVSACPSSALRWGLARPAGFHSWQQPSRPGRWDFTWPQELAALGAGVGGFFVFRSLYGEVPLLLAAGLGCILGWSVAALLRLISIRDMRLNPFQLKRAGCWTPAGVVVAVAIAAGIAFSGHSGLVRLHEHRGHQHWRAFEAGGAEAPAAGYLLLTEYAWIDRWGLWVPPYLNDRAARVATRLNRPDLALPPLQRLALQWPDNRHVAEALTQLSAEVSLNE